MNSKKSPYGIIIHGGARTKKIKESTKMAGETSRFLQSSVSSGFDLLKNGNNALESVETAVAIMEDSGVFNAGAGSCLTLDKQIEMDASIMCGKNLSAGCVGMVNGIRNPIKLARQVMEKTDHVLLVSDGAIKLARLMNMCIENHLPDRHLLRKFYNAKKDIENKWKKNSELIKTSNYNTDYYDTVGSVAIDKDGNMASAVSTGGRWLKMNGRIGDSALVGAGFYADNSTGAACATGYGEYMMRLCLCKYACDQMGYHDAFLAGEKSINLLTRRFGMNTGGIITVDSNGGFGIAHNTISMPVALINSKDEKINVALEGNKIISQKKSL